MPFLKKKIITKTKIKGMDLRHFQVQEREEEKKGDRVWSGYLLGISESLNLKLSFTPSLARAFL